MVNFNSAFILAAASILSTAASSSLPRTNQAEKITVSVENAVGANPSVDVGSGTEIIIISANGGGGAPTQHFNQQAMPVKTVHNVTVGGTAGLVYTPNTITAAVGDIVQFWFESKNHTVTQSSFATPCEKMVGGMDSGFMPNPNNMMSPAPMLEFQVTTSAPIWMYCAQQGHCGMGMVFSINPTTTMTHAMFQAAAMAQNGTKAANPAAAGSAMAMAPSAAASGAAMMAGSSMTGSSMSGSMAGSEMAGSSSTSVTMGTGTLTSGGTCNCACLCGAGSFPAGVGMGMVGGMGGSMPMASAMAMPSGIAMASSMSMGAKMSMATNMPMASTMSMGAKMSMASGMSMGAKMSMATNMPMASTMTMGAKMSMASDMSMATNMPMASNMPMGANMPASPELSQVPAAAVTMTSIIAGPTHF